MYNDYTLFGNTLYFPIDGENASRNLKKILESKSNLPANSAKELKKLIQTINSGNHYVVMKGELK